MKIKTGSKTLKGRALIILQLCILFSLGSFAQVAPVLQGFEMQEISKIADVYEHSQGMSMNLHYYYSDSSFESADIDSLSLSCMLYNQYAYLYNDQLEILHGDTHSIYADRRDSSINVTKKQFFSIFQLPLMDSVFRSSHISGIQVNDINVTRRQIIISFNSNSIYTGYQLIYDPNSELISQVLLFSKQGYVIGLPVKSILKLEIDFTDYSFIIQDQNLFDEGRYINTLNSQITLSPNWQNFHLQNL